MTLLLILFFLSTIALILVVNCLRPWVVVLLGLNGGRLHRQAVDDFVDNEVDFLGI